MTYTLAEFEWRIDFGSPDPKLRKIAVDKGWGDSRVNLVSLLKIDGIFLIDLVKFSFKMHIFLTRELILWRFKVI